MDDGTELANLNDIDEAAAKLPIRDRLHEQLAKVEPPVDLNDDTEELP